MSPRNAPDAAEAARPFCCPATSGGHRAALFAARGCRMSRPEGAAGPRQKDRLDGNPERPMQQARSCLRKDQRTSMVG